MLQMQARQASNTASASAEIHTSGSDETTMPLLITMASMKRVTMSAQKRVLRKKIRK